VLNKRIAVIVVVIAALFAGGIFMLASRTSPPAPAGASGAISATNPSHSVQIPAVPVSVRLPIPIIEAGSTPFFVAIDKGYYLDEGLNVSIEMGSRELNPVKTVSTGSNTFGVLGGPDTLLTARSKGQPLRAIMVLHRNSNFPVLISLRSSNIAKVEDLRDQKVGFFYGHISTDVLRNLFS
jgi:ABC-type nitrate/sulfonate/bicarbonate transport system substrate-binding protein